MNKLNKKERNVLIKLLEDYANQMINETDLMTSFKWTRGFIGMTFDDLIEETCNDKKDQVLFSYKDYGTLRDKLYGDYNGWILLRKQKPL